MAQEVTGGCICGQVRYSGVTKFEPAFRCYCRDCQRVTGTGHAELAPLVRESFSISGPLKLFGMTGTTGRPTWSGFCSTCGSPVTRRSALMSDRIYVHAASLDDPAIYRPMEDIWAQSAQPWDKPSGSA